MMRSGKWRLPALIVAVLVTVCAAIVMPIAFLKSGSHAAHPAHVKARNPAAQKASADKGVSERQQAREKLVALEGADLLEAALDSSQPELAKIVSIARSEGIAPALQALRKYHQALPRQTYLPRIPVSSPTSEIRTLADDIIRKGYQSGINPLFPVTPPVDWTADPYKDRTFRFELHSWKFLDSALKLSQADGGAPYAKYAREIALDWSRRHLAGSASSDFAWYDMAVGLRASMLAVILDDALRDPAVSDDDLVLLLKAACAHARELADPRTLAKHSNHGLFQMGGLLALGATFPELRDAASDRAYAKRMLAEMFSEHFTSEGIHKEHSPGYHVMVTSYLGRLLRTGWLSDNAFLTSLYPRAAWNAIWMMHPDGGLVNVGDTEVAALDERLAHPDDPQVEYALTEGKRGIPPSTTFEVFKKSGYAAFRSPWDFKPWQNASYLFFTAAFHSRVHKHADDFSFEWSELGVRLVQDSGSFAYLKNEPRQEYMESTRAHNTVEIDERDYSRERNDAFGSAITDGGQADGLYYVRADLYRKRFFDTHHRRVIVFAPGQWLVVIDQLRGSGDHKYTQWFHFDPFLLMKPEGDGVGAPIPLIRDTGKRLQIVPLLVPEGQSLEMICGQEKPRLQGWVSLVKTTLTPNDAVGFTQKGKSATFVTLLRVGEANQEIARDAVTTDSAGDSWEVRWKEGGKPDGFRFGIRDGHCILHRLE